MKLDGAILQSIFGLVGVVLGSALTLLGVGLQLRHASKTRKAENEFAVKRDVYLQAAEGVARGQEYLAAFPNLDLDDRALGELLRGVGGWSNKLHVVATLTRC